MFVLVFICLCVCVNMCLYVELYIYLSKSNPFLTFPPPPPPSAQEKQKTYPLSPPLHEFAYTCYKWPEMRYFIDTSEKSSWLFVEGFGSFAEVCYA